MTDTELIEELETLRDARAPASLKPSVLLASGLADACFPLETPLGRLFVAHNERGISAVVYATSEEELERQLGRSVVPQEPPFKLVQTLREWLNGNRAHKLRFDLSGLGPFQQAVLFKALDIPFGQVRPYSWIAREIGHPKAVRAVGTALAHNPIPLFIPCHRVVRSDGQLGNYSLIGPDAKRVVLEAEGVQVNELVRLADSGTRYVGSDSTHVFCFPTCRYNKTLTERHKVQFRSEAAAREAGYRPCKVCRPAVA